MNKSGFVAIALLCVLLLVVAKPSSASDETVSIKALLHLPDPYEKYMVDPYIQAAIRLQKAGEHKAKETIWLPIFCKIPSALSRSDWIYRKSGTLSKETLLALAKDQRSGVRAIVLCRMLFTNKSGQEFRRPRIGAAYFLGGTDYADWTREPIEIFNGIPFWIVETYMLGGRPESPVSYVKYCIHGCDWTSQKYQPVSKKEKKRALDKFISLPKWKTPLDSYDIDFLTSQIR